MFRDEERKKKTLLLYAIWWMHSRSRFFSFNSARVAPHATLRNATTSAERAVVDVYRSECLCCQRSSLEHQSPEMKATKMEKLEPLQHPHKLTSPNNACILTKRTKCDMSAPLVSNQERKLSLLSFRLGLGRLWFTSPRKKLKAAASTERTEQRENFCWKTGTVAAAQSFFAEKSILRANLEKGFLLLITVFERNENLSHEIVIEN